jgi:hypothetical protein
MAQQQQNCHVCMREQLVSMQAEMQQRSQDLLQQVETLTRYADALHTCTRFSRLETRVQIPVGAPLGRGITCYRNRRDCEGEMRSPK